MLQNSSLVCEWKTSFSQVSATAWNALLSEEDSPCLRYEFLANLEESASASPENGWYPQIFLLRQEELLLAAACLWLKNDSRGEYLYDYQYAELAQKLNRSWYPKLLGMIPATPSPAWKILRHPRLPLEQVKDLFFDSLDQKARALGVSHTVLHFTDPSFEAPGTWQFWRGQYWLWEMEESRNFEEYLGRFNKNQRRNIKRELASVEAQGFTLKVVKAQDAPDEWFSRMARFYHQTNDQWGPWAARWVSTEFFTGLKKAGLREHTAFSVAFEPGSTEPCAMALFFFSRDWIVGRYWGSDSAARDLHFAVCYYQIQDFALQERIAYFEPGAGSEHKIRRGFRAKEFKTYFRFYDPLLEQVFRMTIPALNEEIEAYIQALNNESPLKKRDNLA